MVNSKHLSKDHGVTAEVKIGVTDTPFLITYENDFIFHCINKSLKSINISFQRC